MLNKGEEIHDLPAPGYRLIQDRAHFRYGTDAVLLADFCRRDKSAPAADLGAGTGALSILLLAGAKAARVDAVELQPRLCDMARRSAQLNGLSARMAVYEADLRRLDGVLEAGTYGSVVCNPPYRTEGAGRISPDPARRAALFETECTLADALAAGLRLLRSRGRMYLCHRPARLCDLASCAREYGGELKRIRFVHPYADKPASLLLSEICKDGKPGLLCEPPLVLYAEKGEQTAQLRRIYGW